MGSLLYFGRRPEPPSHPIFNQGLADYQYGLERPGPETTGVVLTVSDRVLHEVSMALAARGAPPKGCPVLHTSGAWGADPLEPLHRAGYQVGTLHPLQSIANPLSGAERLTGSGFALSGEPEALVFARRIIGALGGRGITVPVSQRPLYHASAVFASNFLVVLLREAVRLFVEAGASEDEAEQALLALARGTLANAGELGLDQALTGPVKRGDVETVALHLRTLDREGARLYALLGRRALDLSREGLDPQSADSLEQLFDEAG